ncbi:unnamed protein product [Aphanomyces euteiches]
MCSDETPHVIASTSPNQELRLLPGLPQNYTLPNGSLYPMWILGCCGSPAESTPPLRFVSSGWRLDRNLQKRLSDLRFLMRRIESKARSLTMMKTSMTQDEAQKVFLACGDAISINNTTHQSLVRRRGQLTWRTIVKLLRKHLE